MSLGLLCGGPAAAKKLDQKLAAPPAGLSPAATSSAEVLRAHEKALGRLDTGTLNTRREIWALDEAGFAGTETLVRNGLDYRARIEHPPFAEEYGQLGDARWHRGPNGTVMPTQGEDEESFLMLRVLEDAADPKNDITLLGETSAPNPAYVMQVSRPEHDYPEWIFYDKATALVSRTERIIDSERVTSTYDDYRTTKGLTEPWHVHDDLPKEGYAFDYRRTRLDVGGAVSAAELAQPAGHFEPVGYSGNCDLPARVPYGTVTVRLVVAGRGLDFEVSAGSRQSYIDRDVAAELNLPTFGQTLKSKTGEKLGYDTVIEDAKIGTVTLKNFALRAISFNYEAGHDTKVVGTLGTDFLESGVVKIDYDNGRVYLLDPATAKIPTKDDGAFIMPVTFDDGLPLVDGEIGGHATSKILVDNAFDYTYVFGSFVRRYPEAVPDLEGRKHGVGRIPFADSKSYGRDADMWLSTLPKFRIAGQLFANFGVFASDGDLFGNDIDAVLGLNVLQFFDVYLDYQHARIVLMPNGTFHKSFKRVKAS